MSSKDKEKLQISTENTNNDTNKKPNGLPKRQKIVKACKDCRRRKVKCDGGTPCGTCRRSAIPCIFEPSSPKRGATKHYIESLENRINVIERALQTLDDPTMKLVKEAMMKQQLIEEGQQNINSITPYMDYTINPEDRFLINELGSPGYIQDITQSTLDFRYLQQNNNPNYLMPDSQSASTCSPKSINSSSNNSCFKDDTETENHLQFYLEYIQPYFPVFVPSYFQRQYMTNQLPRILIHSICALGSYFQNTGDDDFYYQQTILMLDEAAGRPSIHLIQTLLFLIKYMECITNHPSFFEKTKSLVTRAVELCKLLNLHQLVTQKNNSDPEIETKKRTFCMVFTYSTLLSVEQGIESDFCHLAIKDPNLFLPTTVSEESTVECQRYLISFSFTLFQIHQHIIRVTQRQDVQKEMRNDHQIIEENIALLQLQVMLENDIMNLPSSLSYHHNKLQHQQFPAEEELATNTVITPMARLLHMLYHLNVILLHFHYYIHPLPSGAQQRTNNYSHRQFCISSASFMTRLIEGLISDSNQSYRYAPRGIQFVSYCVTAALTILKFEKSIAKDLQTTGKVYLDEYERCAQLLKRVATASPAHDMRHSAKELEFSVDSLKIETNLSISSSSSSPSPVIPTSIDHSQRRNNLPERSHPQRNQIYPIVPQNLLQSSSANVNHFTFPHQPLQNIHTAPLQVQTQQPPSPQATVPLMRNNGGRGLIRGSTQSCQDLRSIHQSHLTLSPDTLFNQHRKPVSSVISTSTTSTGPYRHLNHLSSSPTHPNLTRHLSPSLPYSKPLPTQDSLIPVIHPHPSQSFPRPQQQQPGKIRRIKKSQSIHGLSNTYQQQHVQQQQPIVTPMIYTQQPLHRPYQPSYDDDFRFQEVSSELDYAMNTDLNFNFLNNFNLNLEPRSEGHQLL